MRIRVKGTGILLWVANHCDDVREIETDIFPEYHVPTRPTGNTPTLSVFPQVEASLTHVKEVLQ